MWTVFIIAGVLLLMLLYFMLERKRMDPNACSNPIRSYDMGITAIDENSKSLERVKTPFEIPNGMLRVYL
jgi:hypothetical protein